MRSDSEALAQIASDVAEIKAAVNKGQSRQESEPCRADLTPEAAREVVERWRIKADLAANGDSDVTDLRNLEGRVCKSPWNLIAKANKGAFMIPIGVPFRVIYAHPERESVMVEYDGNYGWIPPMQEVEVISEPPRPNYRYSDVVLRADVVASIGPESEAFTIATIRLKPLVAFKPERLTVSLTQSARWQNPTKVSRAEFLDLGHLTIMRIRAGDKDVITEPMSVRSQSLGSEFAWPAVRADSEIEITLAISNSVLDRVLPPFGSTKGDLLWVAVRVSLILTGSKLR